MPRKPIVFVFLVLLLLFCAPAGWAWNRAGHMVTGIIAYKELKATNPAALQRIITLLKAHPDYAKWEAQIGQQQLGDEYGEMYLLALAARWADDVRQTSYDHPSWHYINFPFVPPAQFNVTASQPNPDNILSALERNEQILRSKASDEEKAIALCWIFHLVGDIHQPLHTTAFFSNEYQKGDRGGNAIFIRVRPETSTINLHALWDDLILGSERLQATTNRATELRANIQRKTLPELATKQFRAWAEESYNLAVKYAYRNGTIKGGATKDNGVALPDDYIQQTKPIAERRVVLAGYRLADWLAGVNLAATNGAPPPTQPIIGNRKSHIYHVSGCKAYGKVSEANRIYFQSEAEAQQAGYRKAANCP